MKIVKSFRIEQDIADALTLKKINASALVETLLMKFFQKNRKCPICGNIVCNDKDMSDHKKAMHKK